MGFRINKGFEFCKKIELPMATTTVTEGDWVIFSSGYITDCTVSGNVTNVTLTNHAGFAAETKTNAGSAGASNVAVWLVPINNPAVEIEATPTGTITQAEMGTICDLETVSTIDEDDTTLAVTLVGFKMTRFDSTNNLAYGYPATPNA